MKEAKKGEHLAISMSEPTFGRQVRKGQILYTNVREMITNFCQRSSQIS